MHRILPLWISMILLGLALAACAGANPLGEKEATDRAWAALDPNTRSHNRANWEVVEAQRVSGKEVAGQFAGKSASGCWQGPTPPANEEINPDRDYWLIGMQPLPATPMLRERTISPTEPPAVPEPFLVEAYFLISAGDGEVVARKLYCVVY